MCCRFASSWTACFCLALLLVACSEREASGAGLSLRPPTAAGASDYPAADPETGECRAGNSVCRPYAYLEVATVALFETPRFDLDYDRGSWQRTLIIAANSTRKVSYLGADTTLWQIDVDVETDRPSRGQLAFTAQKPFGPGVLPGRALGAWSGTQSDCQSASQAEPVRISAGVLRDDAGSILLAHGHAQLTPEGFAVLDAGELDLRSITVRWLEAGCAACADPAAARNVALALTVTATGESATIVPGERATVRIDGQQYVFMSRGTTRPGKPGARERRCGTAFWSLHRSDFWMRLDEAGMP